MKKSDLFYLIYFIIHIPITILIDSAPLVKYVSDYIPTKFLELQFEIIKFHIHNNNDFLIENPPNWLKLFIGIEVFFQLPLFFYCSWGLYKGYKQTSILLCLYGLEASLSTLVCIFEIYQYPFENSIDKYKLILIYLPTFIIPFTIMIQKTRQIWTHLSYSHIKLD